MKDVFVQQAILTYSPGKTKRSSLGLDVSGKHGMKRSDIQEVDQVDTLDPGVPCFWYQDHLINTCSSGKTR